MYTQSVDEIHSGALMRTAKIPGATMAEAGAINVSAKRAVAGATAMIGTGTNDTLARLPVDRGESLRSTLSWQDSGSRGAGMRTSHPRLKYGYYPLTKGRNNLERMIAYASFG